MSGHLTCNTAVHPVPGYAFSHLTTAPTARMTPAHLVRLSVVKPLYQYSPVFSDCGTRTNYPTLRMHNQRAPGHRPVLLRDITNCVALRPGLSAFLSVGIHRLTLAQPGPGCNLHRHKPYRRQYRLAQTYHFDNCMNYSALPGLRCINIGPRHYMYHSTSCKYR